MFSRRVALVVLVLVLLSKIAGLVLVLLAAACSGAPPQPVAVETPAAAVPVGTDPQPEILGAARLEFEPAEYRTVNSTLATAAIHGQVIMPGGSLSMNALVGEPSLARGYMDGGCIIGGQWATCPGGGVSRVAAALCEAGHLAGMDVSGVPHSMITDAMGYTAGRECTYAWPAHDTTLTNPTPYPVLIGARLEGNVVVVEVVGPKWFDVQSLVEPLTADCRAVVTRSRWLPDGTLFDEETRGTRYESC